jgi:hypothetical protein
VRPSQSVVARGDPRFLGTTIEGDGDAAHGFQGPARGPDDPNGAISDCAVCVFSVPAVRAAGQGPESNERPPFAQARVCNIVTGKESRRYGWALLAGVAVCRVLMR